MTVSCRVLKRKQKVSCRAVAPSFAPSPFYPIVQTPILRHWQMSKSIPSDEPNRVVSDDITQLICGGEACWLGLVPSVMGVLRHGSLCGLLFFYLLHVCKSNS